MRRIFGGFLLALMATGAICAQTQKPESKTIVLKAARLFDGKSATLVTPGMVVVTDGKIVAAGATADAPAGAEVIDLGDATLLPGFIDAHTHLTMMYTTDYKQAMLDGLQKSIPEQTLDAIENARVTLMAGFTTVRDVGSRHFIDVGLRNAIRNGKVPGPRMLVSVHAIGATGGHCDETGFRSGVFGKETGPEEGVANGADEVRYAVRLAHKYGADIIKTCASGGVLSLADDVDTPQLTQEEMNALIDEAHALKRKVAAHAHGAEAAKRAIRAGVDSIEHGSFLDDEALDMMKQHGTYYVPTLMALQGLSEQMQAGMYIPPAIRAKAEHGHDLSAQDISKSPGQGRQDRPGHGRRRLSPRPKRRRISSDGRPGNETARCVAGGNFFGRRFAGTRRQNRNPGARQARRHRRCSGKSSSGYSPDRACFFRDEGRRRFQKRALLRHTEPSRRHLLPQTNRMNCA